MVKKETPVVLCGDFNVMHSPERFDHVMADYPFEVVSRWCHHRPGACDTQISYDGDAPWLDTQDLIGFLDGERVTVTPVAVEATFDGASEVITIDGVEVCIREFTITGTRAMSGSAASSLR